MPFAAGWGLVGGWSGARRRWGGLRSPRVRDRRLELIAAQFDAPWLAARPKRCCPGRTGAAIAVSAPPTVIYASSVGGGVAVPRGPRLPEGRSVHAADLQELTALRWNWQFPAEKLYQGCADHVCSVVTAELHADPSHEGELPIFAITLQYASGNERSSSSPTYGTVSRFEVTDSTVSQHRQARKYVSIMLRSPHTS